MKRLILALFACMMLAPSALCAQGGDSGNSQGALVAHQQGNAQAQPSPYGQGNGSEWANEIGTGQERSEAQAGQETGGGSAVQQEQQARNGGDGQQVAAMQQQQAGHAQAMAINQTIRESEERYGSEASAMPAQQAQIYQNQNRVRVAVQALLGAENITGIGKNVSAIAREFGDSVQATVRAEERMRERDGIGRLLFGGDEKAAEELEQQAAQNRQRIMQMQQLIARCEGCDAQAQSMLQEQLQNVEQEQSRLMQLAQQEKEEKGLLGWLWK